MTTNLRDLPADLTLHHGAHDGPDDPDRPTGCLLEIASWVAREPWSDRPACVSPVLAAFGRSLNDGLSHERRQELLPLVHRMVGTAGDGQDNARAMMALDWLVRTWTPAWLDLAGLAAAAAELRGLRQIVDLVSAQSAGPVVHRARERAAAAWEASVAATGLPARPSPGAAALDATWEAAGAAAWEAAGAARDAAGAAALAAAVAAGWDAAWEAARAAAGAAAWDAAGAAARDAAGAVARDASVAAGWDAAWEAARAAAGEAAGAAALDAAWDAARDATRATLAPTVDQLQTSAIALLAALIQPGGEA